MQKNTLKYRRRKIYTRTLGHPKTLAHTKTLAHPKTLALTKTLAHPKTLALTKTSAHPQTLAHTKTLAHAKNLGAWKTLGIHQCWRSRKSRRRRRRIAFLLGSAESAATDFSQAQLMVSLPCWCVESRTCRLQVRKELPVPCFYGRTLSRTVPVCYTQNGQIFGVPLISLCSTCQREKV